jgi:hypothetical protein
MPMSAAAATEAIVRYDMRVPFSRFRFARHVSERGHGHQDGFRSTQIKPTAVVRLESEQNGSHPTFPRAPQCFLGGDEAAEVAAEAVSRSVELIVQPDADGESCRSWKK